MIARAWLAVLVALVVGGCASGVPADPNDPQDVGLLPGDRIRANLQSTWRMLEARAARRELTPDQQQKLIVRRAKELLEGVDPQRVPREWAWAYADVYRTAQQWAHAEALLRAAVQSATTEDRRVNDALRLAEALARNGKIDEALPMARSTFSARAEDKAPILPAILLELVPAARGKGRDADLAKLLEDAIAQHRLAIVDPETVEGASFLIARPHHIRRAWVMVVTLYRAGGDIQRAQDAIRRAMASEATSIRV